MAKKWDTTLHIGFDDTDSLKGNCTTYIATKIIDRISAKVNFIDYPRLIRNNPNVPWKTRGNGAIALTLGINNDDIKDVISMVIDIINNLSEDDSETNPGFVAVVGTIPQEIRDFSIIALKDVISISQAKEIAIKYCSHHLTIGNGRGLIGAIAAVGNNLDPKIEDFSYELLSYRTPVFIGKKRQVNRESVTKMDEKLSPFVFNNIDEETGKVLIAPAGKDPVLYGIRGENPEILLQALELVQVSEPIDSYCIFRTNQGTDQHFAHSETTIKNFNVFKGEISVVEKPRILEGGHLVFKGRVEDSGRIVDLAAFEPSKKFRNVIRHLLPEDKLIAYGGIRYKHDFETFTIQLEKCEIIFVSEQFKEESPFCPKCEKRMISAGREKGYKCRKCGYKSRDIKKIRTPIKRNLTEGLYIPPAQAQRHLVKPFRRYDLPKKEEIIIIENWIKTYSNS